VVPIILTYLWACSTDAEHPVFEDHAPALLVTLDRTPAARLGAYGYPRAHTPALDALAGQGTLWLRAYTTSVESQPAITSVLTGRVPGTHGVHGDAEFALKAEVSTIASYLRDAGYRTEAVTGTMLTSVESGLMHGFDSHTYVKPERFIWQRWGQPANSEDLVDAALQRLQAAQTRTFLWVHLADGNPSVSLTLPEDRDPQTRSLDARLSHQDQQLERLLDAWSKHAPDGITAVVGIQGHDDSGNAPLGSKADLQDNWVRVPLILAGPGVESGAQSTDVVSTIDFVPTLLALTGVGAPGELQGKDLRNGGSQAAWTEAMFPQLGLGLAPLRAWTDDSGRYVEADRGVFFPFSGIVNVDIQPGGGDLNAMSSRLQDMAQSFQPTRRSPTTLDLNHIRQLDALGYLWGDAHSAQGQADPRDHIDAMTAADQGLRFLSQGRTKPARDQAAILQRRLGPTAIGERIRTRSEIEANRPKDAIEIQHRNFTGHPTKTNAMILAGLYSNIEDWKNAEQWFDQALGGLDLHSSDEPYWPAVEGAVRSAAYQGSEQRAGTVIQAFTHTFPDAPTLQLLSAEAHLSQDHPQQALELARNAQQAMPRSAWAWFGLGRALRDTGQTAEAIEAMRHAIELGPRQATFRRGLANLYEETGDLENALRLLGPLLPTFTEDKVLIQQYDRLRTTSAAEGRVRRPGTGYRSTTKPKGQP